MNRQIAIALIAPILAFTGTVGACTAFLATDGDVVLAGNNEDYVNPRTKVRFVPAEEGRYGRIYFGFDDLYPQGGMNERGLFFDGFATAPRKVVGSTDKPVYAGALIDTVMAECATVEEVLVVFEKYNLEFMERAMLMFGDATGDSAIIEGDDVVRKQGRFQVVTNFYQSQTPAGQEPCARYRIAVRMLENAEEISVPLCRRILSAVHAEPSTLYSNIYDLRRRRVYLYHFHNFENVVVFDLAEELKKGKRVLDLPSLFPPTFAAEEFARRQMRELEQQKGVRRVDIDPGLLDRYVGQYQLTSGFIPGLLVTMLREGDRLWAELPAMAKVELSAESPTDFFYLTYGSLLKLAFTEDDGGHVTGFEADIDGQKYKARKIP
ncbi:MAG: hypothetical protein JW741_17130 [Sedimentisphaerales bacterium]|nr:hypothetical protein [Sedimentisphaerales bacterium]